MSVVVLWLTAEKGTHVRLGTSRFKSTYNSQLSQVSRAAPQDTVNSSVDNGKGLEEALRAKKTEKAAGDVWQRQVISFRRGKPGLQARSMSHGQH